MIISEPGVRFFGKQKLGAVVVYQAYGVNYREQSIRIRSFITFFRNSYSGLRPGVALAATRSLFLSPPASLSYGVKHTNPAILVVTESR